MPTDELTKWDLAQAWEEGYIACMRFQGEFEKWGKTLGAEIPEAPPAPVNPYRNPNA